ncbi:hypothetical protein DFJ74DRAFT_729148 [Hyaloraphidium curvatum]|nr:hypothetical protein DFJ74DRAFT_729148 [Hyaloraphidium curvatum]
MPPVTTQPKPPDPSECGLPPVRRDGPMLATGGESPSADGAADPFAAGAWTRDGAGWLLPFGAADFWEPLLGPYPSPSPPPRTIPGRPAHDPTPCLAERLAAPMFPPPGPVPVPHADAALFGPPILECSPLPSPAPATTAHGRRRRKICAPEAAVDGIKAVSHLSFRKHRPPSVIVLVVTARGLPDPVTDRSSETEGTGDPSYAVGPSLPPCHKSDSRSPIPAASESSWNTFPGNACARRSPSPETPARGGRTAPAARRSSAGGG